MHATRSETRRRPASPRLIPAALAWLLVAGLFLLTAPPADAQAYGRVVFKVVDEAGESLGKVSVTATADSLPDFAESRSTNRKGSVTFGFGDATRVYRFTFVLEGYQEVITEVRPPTRGTTTRTIALPKLGATPAEQPAGSEAAAPASQPTGQLSSAAKLFNQGVDALERDSLEEAEAIFLQARDKKETEAAARSALSGLYLRQERFGDALGEAEALAALEPDNPRALRLLYAAHQGLGNEDGAKAALQRLSEMRAGGDTAALIFNEGVDSLNVGDLAAARARFEEALELDPELAPALSTLSWIALRQGDAAEALSFADRALALDPQAKRALEVRLDAYRALGDDAGAAAALKELAAADPARFAQEAYQAGVELFEAGDLEGAQRKFEEVLTLDPNQAKAHYRLALCLVSSGDTARAKELLSRFLELAPDDTEAPAAREMLTYLE